MTDTQNLPEMQDLSEQIGEFVYYWGFKRIHGRIWTHLFLAQKPLDAADLVRLMKISKALVSISLRELMEYEVIQFSGKSARGTQLYKVNPDILSVIMSVLRQREKRMISHVQAAQEGLMRASETDRAKTGVSTENLRQLGELVQKASFALDSFIALKPVDFSDWHSIFMLKDGKDETGVARAKNQSISQQDSQSSPQQAQPGGYPLTAARESKAEAESDGNSGEGNFQTANRDLLPTARHAF